MTSSTMYAFAFLLLRATAVAYVFWASRVVTMCSHTDIWSRYLCTERPKVQQICRHEQAVAIMLTH